MMAFGFVYSWHHSERGGSYPASSPTQWCFGSNCSRIFSKLDMWRPCKDWHNRRWCEVALFMPKCTLHLRSESARRSTMASCVECLVGLITVIGSSGRFLPDGNALEIVFPSRIQGPTSEIPALNPNLENPEPEIQRLDNSKFEISYLKSNISNPTSGMPHMKSQI